MCPGAAKTVLVLCVLPALAACQRGPRPAHPDPDGALAACLAGIERSRRAAAAEKFATIATACAGLYVEKPCRQAMTYQLARPPDARAAIVAEACRAAYCPSLAAEPRPRLCTAERLPANPLRLREAWWELQWRILARDLGPERAARLYGLMLLEDLAHRPIMVTPPSLELSRPPRQPPDRPQSATRSESGN